MNANATPPAAPPPGDRQDLFSLFVGRPVLTAMVTLALTLVGLIAFGRLPLRFAPEGMAQNEINVWIPVRQNRTPEEIEDKVVEPFEQLLRTIPGLQSVRSDIDSNSAHVEIELDEGMDPVLAAAEVRDRAQRARAQWPSDVDRYFTWREDASSVPLAFFQMLTPARSPDWDFLIDKLVQPRLEAVDGVGRVDVWGLLDETIRIWFDRDKLTAHRVDYYRLMQRMQADNFAEPVGELDDGRHRYLLRVDTKFKSLAQIERYPIKPGLVLGDVARVERVPSVRNSLSRFNQKYTYTGYVRAAAGVNPVDASRNLKAAMAELRRDSRLADLEFRFLFDQGEMITDSLDTLVSTSLQGGLLALITLLLFLRNIRFTVAIGLAIPLALLIDGAWLFFTGGTLNILTMAGMTLAVGMVVDNSVVVLENIRRLRDLGLPLRDACIQGAREVGLAVSMATLTTVVVILPMIFIGDGQARVMLGAVGIPLSVALIGSLCVALLLMPSGLCHLGGAGGTGAARVASPPPGGLLRLLALLSPVHLLLRFNQLLLRIALRHRLLACLAGLGCLATCYYPYQHMEFSAGSGGIFRHGDVSVRMEMPRGLDLGQVEKEIIAYEDFVLAHKQEWHVESVSSRFSRRNATVDIELSDDVPDLEFKKYRALIEKAWPQRPGVKVKLSDRGNGGGMGGGGSGEEKEERSFVVRLYGRDTEHLIGLATRVRKAMAQLPEVDKVEIPQMESDQEVLVRLRRDRMQDLSVRPEILFGTVASGLQGRMLTEFEERGRETRLIAEFDSEHNPSLLDLRDTKVFAGNRTFQRLDNLSDIGFEEAMGSIDRVDGRTNVTLVGRRATGVGPLALSRALQTVMRRFPLPRGYSWSEESQFLDSREQAFELIDALYLGVTLVFLLMGVLFESVILPGSILFTVPFAICGAMWTLYALVGELDPMAFVGMILLAGIVVNNGIVLLDCIAKLRQHMDRETAIMEGTRRRLRPIVMTALTTIFGLLPMALFGDSSGQGLSYVSMSIVVAGGLGVCTVFTAFVVPLTYTFMDDLSHWLREVWRRATRGLRRVDPTAAVTGEP